MPILPGKTHFSLAFKVTAAILSAGTAAVSILAFARDYGLVGAPTPAVLTVGDLGVSWVGLQPATDTATALGDTLRLAATVTDVNGTSLVGATIHWTSDDPSVARVIGGGRVVAVGPGTATIIAEAGDVLAKSRVTVRQRVTTVRLDGDSALALTEGERRRVPVTAFDARGFAIPARRTLWRSLDTTVLTIDSSGVAAGRAPGATEVTASIDDVSARLAARVTARPASMAVISGDDQRARAGAPLPLPIVVRVLSTRGRPIAGETVRFRTSDGRGSVDPAIATTDEEGRAHTSWTLAELPGRQHLFATSERIDTVAAIVAESDPVAANTRVRALGDALTGRVGATLPDTLGVRVTDTLGRALADVPVSWSTDDGGRIGGIAERTDSSGIARALWTLGPRSGAQRARLRVGSGRSVPPFAIVATATAADPATLALVSGDAQRGRVGEALHHPVVLRVTDATGNAVIGARVALHAGDGELGDTLPATDSAGCVRITWTMPRTTGARRLAARVAGVSKGVTATATALPGAPANVTFGAPARAAKGSEASSRIVSVLVSDLYGNPVPEAVVMFTTRAGTAAPRKVAADAHGVARTRWTPGGEQGTQTLVASVPAADARSTLTLFVPASSTSAPTSRARGARRRRP